MPAVGNPGGSAVVDAGEATKPASARANAEAAKLLNVFAAAKPDPDGFLSGHGMPGGGDIPKPTGLYTNALIGPEVWPSESENALIDAGQDLYRLCDRHRTASEQAKNVSDQVFSESWISGDGAEAAYVHYIGEQSAHEDLIEVLGGVAAVQGRLAGHISRAKRDMRDAHDQAHREIEDYLRAPGGIPTAVIGSVILPKYRGLIEGYADQLRGQVADETSFLTNKFGPLPDSPATQSGGRGNAPSSERGDAEEAGDKRDGHEHAAAGAGRGNSFTDQGGATSNAELSPAGSASDVLSPGIVGRGNAPTMPDAKLGNPIKPSLPSMPATPSIGGSGSTSPLSGMGSGAAGSLQGLVGGAKVASPGTPGLGPGGTGGASSNSLPNPLGVEFGRGLATGTAATGAIPPSGGISTSGGAAGQMPVPQTPAGPIAATQSASPLSAAPAAATAPSASAPTTTVGSPTAAPGVAASAPLTSYGSVLPPSAVGGAGGGSAAATFPSSAPPQVTGGSGTPAAPSFIPGVREVSQTRQVGRGLSMTDLETARTVVADLAAASSGVYPGLEWAVAVARGASGLPELWITSNEGAGYMPSGVFVPRSMPLAARFDPDFDERWFGWFNPAETVLRAVRARGEALSAIATTWTQDSLEVRSATNEVAIAVAPSGGPSDADSATLTRGRSHRLETIAPGLYQALTRLEGGQAEEYARQVTQLVVFSGSDISAVAQSVARALIAARWPSTGEWATLRAEYETDRLMAGSQRPGLMGVEEPRQLVAYQQEFAHCRRLESLLCWQEHGPADIVYAAIMAGVSVPDLS
ncbi:hypothetical protein [Mycolicibacterium tusciae]|uniref:hypothetical protein n=1 Tax=Mycolicibacterium tusciae TaxID=75922 RepID=UPI00024A1F36|nr:hypothetical protein [Mycolicibacterium tusciae]